MFVSAVQTACSICRDRFGRQGGDCCGRCHRIVCRACASLRGRSHESVLCTECRAVPRPTGFRATPMYRSWRRLLAG
jgi:hypothetical protein